MTQIFDENGAAQPVTLIQAGPCTVTQILDEEKHSYRAVQIGFGKKKLNKPQRGHLKDFMEEGSKGFAVLREFSVSEAALKRGDVIDVAQFEVGDRVMVSGTSKAKGFQGVVKRWNFAGGPKTHGQKHSLRAPGSIGSAFPQHVMKGKKMAGRMGGVRSSTRNLRVLLIDKEKNIIVLKGAVAGNNGAYVEIATQQQA